MTTISTPVNVASTRPVISTRSKPRTVISAQAPSANCHHGAWIPKWAAAWDAANGPSIPYSAICRHE